MSAIRLGLIGDNIAASRAPDLHRIAGRICGLKVTYELLVPKQLHLDFDAVFDHARDQGYRGLNITYPYKERVVCRLAIDDASVRSIGACNTAVFEGVQPKGTNTDYSGFIRAYRNTYGPLSPGIVAMAGSGGVGRAIAFAMARLGAKALWLFDIDRTKSESLARSLAAIFPALDVQIALSIEQVCDGADGLVNCTPVGMVGYDGNAFPAGACRGRGWAFDAVYTPVETPFVRDARAAGLAVMSGYELFFYQGVDAFRIFANCEVDPAALRKALEKNCGEV